MTVKLIPHSRPWISPEDHSAVRNTLSSGMIAQGPKTQVFESAVCSYLGAAHAIAQSSGTAAMILALKTLNVSDGDEVVLPTYVCRSVLDAVLTVGATPRLCDVNESGVITPDKVAALVTKKTKTIIAVHIFGHPCDVVSLVDLGVPVIEDACQAFGLLVQGRMSATLGAIGVLSFHATKCLTTAEGGMLITQDPLLAERARCIADGAEFPAGRSVAPMSDLQAALGLSQLCRYGDFLERRATLRNLYSAVSKSERLISGVNESSNMLFRYTFRVDSPYESIQAAFAERGVSVRRGVDALLHRLLGIVDENFPNAIRLFNQTVSVPFYPALTETEAMTIANTLSLLRHDSN